LTPRAMPRPDRGLVAAFQVQNAVGPDLIVQGRGCVVRHQDVAIARDLGRGAPVIEAPVDAGHELVSGRALFKGQTVGAIKEDRRHRQARQDRGGRNLCDLGLVEIGGARQVETTHGVRGPMIARDNVDALGFRVHAVDEEAGGAKASARARRIDQVEDRNGRGRTGGRALDVLREHDPVIDLDLIGVDRHFEGAVMIDAAQGVVGGLFRLQRLAAKGLGGGAGRREGANFHRRAHARNGDEVGRSCG